MTSPSLEMGEGHGDVEKDTSQPIGEEDMKFLWKGFSKDLEGVKPFQTEREMSQCLQVDVSACDELDVRIGGGYIFGTCLGVYTQEWDDFQEGRCVALRCMKTISILREAKEE
jgi:hypothetical protein